MKKTVKGLIIAASVAAVVGVGAVSFAAWSAGSNKTVEVNGSTGSINTIGALTVTPVTQSGTLEKMNALYPVNQGESYLTYWEFDVTVSGEGEQTVTVKGELEQATGGTAVGSAALFYSTTAPQNAVVDGAKNIATEQNITLEESGATKVYIYMTADDTDAMKASIKLTFVAAPKAAA